MGKTALAATCEGMSPPNDWDRAVRRELAKLYFDGMDVDLLGSHSQKNIQAIYAELIALLFGATEPQENPAAMRSRRNNLRWLAGVQQTGETKSFQ